MRKVANGATVICETPCPNTPGWNVVLCDWNGKSVSWLENAEEGYTIEGCYHGDAIPGFLRRSGLKTLEGWTNGVAE